MERNTMKNIYKGLTVLLGFMLASLAMNAQERDGGYENTPAAFEKFAMLRLWHNTPNAAGSMLEKHRRYADAKFGYKIYDGDFNRPQAGEAGNSFTFSTEGGGAVNNKFYAWGSFDYSRDKLKDALYNASILDPFRDMPYMVGDTNNSDWNNQHYILKWRVATPRYWNFLSFGIAGKYQTSIGAKQVDPRVESRFYTFMIQPGLVFSFSEQHHLGFNFEYYSIRESSEMNNVNTYVDQHYWPMYGLGTSVEKIGSGYTTNYNGNSVGGGLQYNYQGAVNLMVSGSYAKKVEDAEISFTNPQSNGTVKDQRIKASLDMYFDCSENYTSVVRMAYQRKDADGIQYIQTYNSSEDNAGYVTWYKSVRSTYQTDAVQFSYDLMKNRGDAYVWKAGITLNYENNRETYVLPESWREWENLKFGVHGKYNARLSDKLTKRLLIGLGCWYTTNLSGKYDYNGQNPESPMVTRFMPRDFSYLSSDYVDGRIGLTYSQRVKADKKANLFGKAEFRYLNTSNADFKDKKIMQFSIGCNF